MNLHGNFTGAFHRMRLAAMVQTKTCTCIHMCMERMLLHSTLDGHLQVGKWLRGFDSQHSPADCLGLAA